jgi:hypothetical protein
VPVSVDSVVDGVGAALRGSVPKAELAPGDRVVPKGRVGPGGATISPNPNGSVGFCVPPGVVVPVPLGDVPVVPDAFPEFEPVPVPLLLPLPGRVPLPEVPVPVPEVPVPNGSFGSAPPEELAGVLPPLVAGVPLVPPVVPLDPKPVPACPRATLVHTHPARKMGIQGRANVIKAGGRVKKGSRS